ncbi:MAG: ATP-binding protein [Nanoarchaeota archaeon]|nr:ATP-binding protein [Nanoarchaeota archaeon]MBU1320784.1 ATP-binding protein [Nanoarchaeota archaeon]MBU1598289.1 ATP-binding protein [Nanoarchaeota archaeon]MBU2442253.1 ATP-binding protein [Nanoarchaeota archaeon]
MVTYDLMRQQIERETSDYLSQVDSKAVNISKPKLSYKRGAISIELMVNEFSKGEVLSVVDILKEYYEHFSKLDPSYGGYKIVAELKQAWLQKFKDKEKKQNSMEISFKLDTYTGSADQITNTITFEKEAELSQEEINCFLEIWKKYALKSDIENSGKIDVKGSLNEIGALLYETNQDFTWKCIAGYEGVKQEVKDTIILPFKHPEVYKGVGELSRTHFTSNVPRAILFEGPSGTGKTTMARVIANESDLPLIYVPIESIMSCWYGVAERRLSRIFDYSSKLEQSILFLDEIDSLAGSREKEMHEATRRILSVLLRKMQGFVSVDNVVTIGATNRVNDLDHALLSRFNRTITFPLPDQGERKAIFHYYAKHLSPEDVEKLTEATEKMSGRDIEDICSDAERIWARKIISDKSEVSPPSFEVYIESVQSKSNNG